MDGSLKTESAWPCPGSLDALSAAADSDRLMLKYEKVRVWRSTIPTGDKEIWHTHQRASLMLIDQSAIRYFRSDDDFDERHRIAPKDGMVRIEWLEPEGIHVSGILTPLHTMLFGLNSKMVER